MRQKVEKRRRERLEKESGSLRDRTTAKTEEEMKKLKEELETLRSEHKGEARLVFSLMLIAPLPDYCKTHSPI